RRISAAPAGGPRSGTVPRGRGRPSAARCVRRFRPVATPDRGPPARSATPAARGGGGAVSFQVLRFGRKEPVDDRGGLFPAAHLRLQLLAALPREAIEAGFAIVLGGAPLGRDRSFLFQLEQHRVEGSLIDRQEITT